MYSENFLTGLCMGKGKVLQLTGIVVKTEPFAFQPSISEPPPQTLLRFMCTLGMLAS